MPCPAKRSSRQLLTFMIRKIPDCISCSDCSRQPQAKLFHLLDAGNNHAASTQEGNSSGADRSSDQPHDDALSTRAGSSSN